MIEWRDDIEEPWMDAFRSKLTRNAVLNATVHTHHMWAEYKLRAKEAGKWTGVTQKQFRNILFAIHTEIWLEVIKTLWVACMPHNLGRQFVAELRPRDPDVQGTYIHWPDTKKAGKIVRRYNTHTNGRRFALRVKTRAERQVAHRSLYHFRISKTVRQMLGTWIDETINNPKLPEYRALPDY